MPPQFTLYWSDVNQSKGGSAVAQFKCYVFSGFNLCPCNRVVAKKGKIIFTPFWKYCTYCSWFADTSRAAFSVLCPVLCRKSLSEDQSGFNLSPFQVQINLSKLQFAK